MLKKQDYINGARTVSSFSRINLIIKFFYNNETKLFVVEVRSIITDEIKTVDYFLPNEFKIQKGDVLKNCYPSQKQVLRWFKWDCERIIKYKNTNNEQD